MVKTHPNPPLKWREHRLFFEQLTTAIALRKLSDATFSADPMYGMKKEY
jgi:hypothetical protein